MAAKKVTGSVVEHQRKQDRRRTRGPSKDAPVLTEKYCPAEGGHTAPISEFYRVSAARYRGGYRYSALCKKHSNERTTKYIAERTKRDPAFAEKMRVAKRESINRIRAETRAAASADERGRILSLLAQHQDRLESREATMVEQRYRDEMTLDAIGKEHGISKEGARLVIQKALKKLALP